MPRCANDQVPRSRGCVTGGIIRQSQHPRNPSVDTESDRFRLLESCVCRKVVPFLGHGLGISHPGGGDVRPVRLNKRQATFQVAHQYFKWVLAPRPRSASDNKWFKTFLHGFKADSGSSTTGIKHLYYSRRMLWNAYLSSGSDGRLEPVPAPLRRLIEVRGLPGSPPSCPERLESRPPVVRIRVRSS